MSRKSKCRACGTIETGLFNAIGECRICGSFRGEYRDYSTIECELVGTTLSDLNYDYELAQQIGEERD